MIEASRRAEPMNQHRLAIPTAALLVISFVGCSGSGATNMTPAQSTASRERGLAISSGGGGGPTCPGANSTLIGYLNSAGPSNYAVLSLGGERAGIDVNLATVTGNVGAPNYNTVQESKPSTIDGELVIGSDVNASAVVGTYRSIVVDDYDLANAVNDAQSAASYFAGLASTPAVQAQFPSNGQITTSLTIIGTPGLNVVNLPAFMLNNGSGTLTLSGPAGTAFVINDSGTFSLHTGNIAVSDGVGPLDVVYNITNPDAAVTTMVPTTAAGILLAPQNAITSMDSSAYTGEIVGGYQKNIVLMSGTHVTNPCQE
jgi:hypothetical protein